MKSRTRSARNGSEAELVDAPDLKYVDYAGRVINRE